MTDVLDLLAAGLSFDEILVEMPDLEPEDIVASIQFAARKLNHPAMRVSHKSVSVELSPLRGGRVPAGIGPTSVVRVRLHPNGSGSGDPDLQ